MKPKNEAASQLAKRLWDGLTPEERSERAKQAAKRRYRNVGKKELSERMRKLSAKGVAARKRKRKREAGS